MVVHPGEEMPVGKKSSGLGLAHSRDRKQHVSWQISPKTPTRKGEIKYRTAPLT